ncbi:MAG TPA: ABC transporter permease subunit [Holophagaceae bacterium]|jgi:peptide/nickel transport system permease protein|nr:ABC transporter permease subunit [Holophagaceae bacterium]
MRSGCRAGFLILLMSGWAFGGDGVVDLAHRMQGPDGAHLFGTDEVGRDLLARCWLGGARSLTLGLALTALHLAVGVMMALAAQAALPARRVVLGLADLVASVPATLLALLLLAFLRPGYGALVTALAIGGWIAYARLALVQLDALRDDPSLLQARLNGAGPWRRLRIHLLPRMAPVLLAQASAGIGAVALVEGGLSFLGVGLPPDQASWGQMLATARAYFLVSPWPLLWPCLGLFALLLATGPDLQRRSGIPEDG